MKLNNAKNSPIMILQRWRKVTSVVVDVGRSCSKCKVPFVISKTENGRFVSMKEPAYDCKLCQIVLCYICYVDGLNNNSVRGRRRN